MPVDEINDNIPCPECGQDECVCEIDPEYMNDYYSDDPEDYDEEENEELEGYKDES